MKFVMLQCPRCGSHSSVDLVAEVGQEEPPLRCPMAQCSGWVTHMERQGRRKEFWGCGACGSVWKSFASLQEAIDAIVARFPYRRKSYLREGSQWGPSDADKEVADYEQRVRQERLRGSK